MTHTWQYVIGRRNDVVAGFTVYTTVRELRAPPASLPRRAPVELVWCKNCGSKGARKNNRGVPEEAQEKEGRFLRIFAENIQDYILESQLGEHPGLIRGTEGRSGGVTTRNMGLK